MHVFYKEYYITYSIAAIIAIFYSLKLDNHFKLNRNYNLLALILTIALFAILGFRGYDIGTDVINYMGQWLNIDTIDYKKNEFLHLVLMKGLQFMSFSFRAFLVVMAFLYTFFIYQTTKALSKIFETNSFLVLFSIISMFSFIPMGVNILRQGVALSIFCLFVISYNNSPLFKKITLAFLSIFMHFTTILPFALFLILKKTPSIRLNLLYSFFFISIILALLNFDIRNFTDFILPLMDEGRATYLDGAESEVYVTGFKPQFVLFNTIFLSIFIFIRKQISRSSISDIYDLFLKFFVAMSSVFFLTFQMNYSDRVGLMSWIMIPILLAPIFSPQIRVPRIKTVTTLFIILTFIFFQIYD